MSVGIEAVVNLQDGGVVFVLNKRIEGGSVLPFSKGLLVIKIPLTYIFIVLDGHYFKMSFSSTFFVTLKLKRNDGHPEFMSQNNGLSGAKNSQLKLKNHCLL